MVLFLSVHNVHAELVEEKCGNSYFGNPQNANIKGLFIKMDFKHAGSVKN